MPSIYPSGQEAMIIVWKILGLEDRDLNLRGLYLSLRNYDLAIT